MLNLALPTNPKKSIYSRISNPVRKAAYLFVLCATHPPYSKHKKLLGGVLDMLDGLEYHIRGIRTYEKAACRFAANLNALRKTKEPFTLSKRNNHHQAVHEAVAYINRLGQLMKFFTSKWFLRVVGEANAVSRIPSILALMPLRDKFTAHRQQDDSREVDCKSLGLNEFGLKHLLSGSLEKPDDVKIEYQFPTKQRNRLLRKCKIPPVKEIEKLGKNNHLIIFTPTQIHHRIINEAINLLQHFFNFQP